MLFVSAAIVFAGCGGSSHDVYVAKCDSNCAGQEGAGATSSAGEGPTGASGAAGVADEGAGGNGGSSGEIGAAGNGGAPVCTGGEAPLFCDGKCFDSNQDNANCGECGHVCVAPATCIYGICQS